MGVAGFQRAAECSAGMEQFLLADDLGKAGRSQAHGQRGLVDPDARPRSGRAFVRREELTLHRWSIAREPIPETCFGSQRGSIRPAV
jgi:hypothetical protein